MESPENAYQDTPLSSCVVRLRRLFGDFVPNVAQLSTSSNEPVCWGAKARVEKWKTAEIRLGCSFITLLDSARAKKKAPTRTGALFREIQLKGELQPHPHGAGHRLGLVEV